MPRLHKLYLHTVAVARWSVLWMTPCLHIMAMHSSWDREYAHAYWLTGAFHAMPAKMKLLKLCCQDIQNRIYFSAEKNILKKTEFYVICKLLFPTHDFLYIVYMYIVLDYKYHCILYVAICKWPLALWCLINWLIFEISGPVEAWYCAGWFMDRWQPKHVASDHDEVFW